MMLIVGVALLLMAYIFLEGSIAYKQNTLRVIFYLIFNFSFNLLSFTTDSFSALTCTPRNS